MIKTKLFFWPGSVYSTLYYVRFDDDSRIIESIDYERQASLMAFDEKGILFGSQAIDVQSISSALTLQNPAEMIDNNPISYKGERLNFLDALSLLFIYMFQHLDKKIIEQYGHAIEKMTETRIIDLGNVLSDNPIRTVSAMNSYLDLDYKIISKDQVFKILLNKTGLSGKISNIITADDYMEKESTDKSFSNVTETKISGTEILTSLSKLLIEEGLTENDATCQIYPFLNKLIYCENSDWVEQNHFSLHHNTNQSWVLDRLHVENIIDDLINEQGIKKNSSVQNNSIIIGDYTYLVKDKFNNVIDCLPREKIISQLLGDIPALPFDKDKHNIINIKVNNEKSYQFKWKPKDLPKTLKFKHEVRFFGRSNESLEISIADDYGKLMAWDISLSTGRSVDISEIEIHLLINRNNKIELQIEDADTLFVEEIKAQAFNSDDSLRPVTLREEIIEII